MAKLGPHGYEERTEQALFPKSFGRNIKDSVAVVLKEETKLLT